MGKRLRCFMEGDEWVDAGSEAASSGVSPSGSPGKGDLIEAPVEATSTEIPPADPEAREDGVSEGGDSDVEDLPKPESDEALATIATMEWFVHPQRKKAHVVVSTETNRFGEERHVPACQETFFKKDFAHAGIGLHHISARGLTLCGGCARHVANLGLDQFDDF